MADDNIRKKARITKLITRAVVAAIIIWVLASNENVRSMIHRFYNFLPPQKVTLTILLKNEQREALSSHLLIFDKKDSAYTDNDGQLTIDLLKGRHVCAIFYGDSTHNDVLNLQKDSLISMTMLIHEPDIAKGGYGVTDTTVQSDIKYPAQYFTMGNSLQFGHIAVKFLKFDNSPNAIFISVCHTGKDYVCQNTIIANTVLSEDSLVHFTDNRYHYKLILQRIVQVPTDSTIRVAYVSMLQSRK